MPQEKHDNQHPLSAAMNRGIDGAGHARRSASGRTMSIIDFDAYVHHMRTKLLLKLPLSLTLIGMVGRAPPAAPTSPTEGPGVAPAPQKTLQIIQRGEPPTLALKSLVPGGGALGIPPRFFNASFAITNTREITQPRTPADPKGKSTCGSGGIRGLWR